MTIEYVKEGHIAIFTINNPEVMNALTPTEVAEWTDNLIDFREDKNLWVGIITGAGEKAFCTGLNLRSAGGEQGKGARPIPKETLVKGLDLYKPLIAAINGYALGGGLEISLACDIRVASENAQLGLTEVTLGLIPGWGGSQRLPRLIPFGIAAEMMIMGRRVKADEALRIGLVHEVVPQSELMAAARARAEKICESAPLAVQAVKEAMLKGIDMDLIDGLNLEGELGRSVVSSKDFAEGRKAFMEKRKPEYKGE
ncbi:MAG: enoyl-CoA hydratase/isomerase family protein [Dehalococcoidales bacterium]|nr:enoyl-CoA hydratase/isomerase family protein [Dehalococcoidales bacterium]